MQSATFQSEGLKSQNHCLSKPEDALKRSKLQSPFFVCLFVQVTVNMFSCCAINIWRLSQSNFRMAREACSVIRSVSLLGVFLFRQWPPSKSQGVRFFKMRDAPENQALEDLGRANVRRETGCSASNSRVAICPSPSAPLQNQS